LAKSVDQAWWPTLEKYAAKSGFTATASTPATPPTASATPSATPPATAPGIVDVKDAATKLTKLYEDKSYYNEIAEACYKVTQNPAYRWDRIADAFNKAVEELSK
jgi:glycosyltransferase involved in cell wall biosynthesis